MLFTTANAMLITGADRLKFNEAVSRGHYLCAPDPDGHNYRLFDDPALVGLFIFARMIEDDVPPRLAGRWACQVERAARDRPGLENVFFAQLCDGTTTILYSFEDFSQRQDIIRSRHFGIGAMLGQMQTLQTFIEKREGAPLL
jgi:hypothetical protein